MKNGIKSNSSNIHLYLICGIVASIVFSWLRINSFFIILLSACWLAEGGFQQKWQLLSKDLLFKAYVFYFLVQLSALLYPGDLHASLKYTEGQVGYLVIPIILCSTPHIDVRFRKNIMRFLNFCLLAASLYCLIMATVKYSHLHDPSVFFYHDLLSPLSHHAIYFSVFIAINLLYLMLATDWHVQPILARVWYGFLIFYFFILLLLLSSKLVLVIVFLYMVAVTFNYLINRQKWKAIALSCFLAIVLAAIALGDNPVKQRFSNMMEANIAMLSNDHYNPGTSFTGVDFRLLLWRITYKILKENHAFITGIGPASAQPLLRSEYIKLNMYAGNEKKGDTGFLNYNCHNQFLQSTLQSGIFGLAALLFLMLVLVKRASQKKELVLYGILLILISFCFTESVFVRQYGMFLFTVIPLLYLYTGNVKKAASPQL